MTKIVRMIAAVGVLMVSQDAQAASWSLLTVSVDSQAVPKVVAAADKLMSSKVGKEFAGKLLLQAVVANGADPATHAFVPIYDSAADREAFIEKLQADPAWSEFVKTTSSISKPVSQTLYRTVKSWGDQVDTDHVWIAHAFQVNDPAGFQAAIESFMVSATGKSFPGQVYLSEVVAGGISPATHVISVGYASEAEMESWTATRNASADWAAYTAKARTVGKHLGATLSRDVKSWGPATLKEIGQ